jgi:4-oxalocrotonate tautomerase
LRLPLSSESKIQLQEVIMPVVHVEMWPGRTPAQKQELAKAITDAMVRIANTTPEATIIIFNDVSKENWAQGGSLATSL